MSEQPETPPRRSRRSLRVVSTQGITALLGAAIIILALNCNAWVIKAQDVIANLERIEGLYRDIDHSDLVLMYDLCNRNGQELSPSDLSRFVRVANSVQTHDALRTKALDEAQVLNNSLRIDYALRATQVTAAGVVSALGLMPGGEASAEPAAPATAPGVPDAAPQATPGQIVQDQAFVMDTSKQLTFLPGGQTGGGQICATLAHDPADLMANFRLWRASLSGVTKELNVTFGDMMFTGWGPGQNEVLMQDIRSRLVEISRWWLPILYGALGAVLFCLVRMLDKDQISPKLSEVLLRMVFGAFAGFVVSTLFVPSGVFTGQFSGSTPGASLLSLVFGYSLDSFTALLTRLNQLVVDSTRKASPPDR